MRVGVGSLPTLANSADDSGRSSDRVRNRILRVQRRSQKGSAYWVSNMLSRGQPALDNMDAPHVLTTSPLFLAFKRGHQLTAFAGAFSLRPSLYFRAGCSISFIDKKAINIETPAASVNQAQEPVMPNAINEEMTGMCQR